MAAVAAAVGVGVIGVAAVPSLGDGAGHAATQPLDGTQFNAFTRAAVCAPRRDYHR